MNNGMRSADLLPNKTDADAMQELKEGIGARARGNQAYSERSIGNWSVYGSHRSKVSCSTARSNSPLIPSALASYNRQQGLIMLSESSLHLIASCLSHHPLSPSTATRIPLLISFLLRQTPLLPCLEQMRSQM
jgi:hypothetical protein